MTVATGWTDLLDASGLDFDRSLDVEVQTDKDRKKALPCVVCKRPLIASAFYVPSNARCAQHKASTVAAGGRSATGGREGSVAAPRRGSTDPAKAANLADCLVNRQFGHAMCPTAPGDPDHTMQLVSVAHSDRYGPSALAGHDSKGPVYKQYAVGESVLHQCQRCKATVSYSTMAQVLYRRQSESMAQPGNPNGSWETLLGARS